MTNESNIAPANERNCSTKEINLRCIKCAASDAYDVLTFCLHSVCQKCMESIKQDDKYLCPHCDEHSSSTIQNPLLCKNEANQKSPECKWCETNGEHTKSTGNCKECDVWLCGECLKGHNRMPPLRNHTLTMLPKSDNQGSLHCSIHPNENLECFCEACGILTCRDCQLSVHRDHGSHRWVGEKAGLLAEPLQSAIEGLQQCQSKLSTTRLAVKSAFTNTNDGSFLGSVEKARLAIEARASSLILRIRSHADELLKTLNTKCTDSVNQLMATENLLDEIEERIIHTIKFANRLIENKESDPASLVQLYDVVQSRIDLLNDRALRLLKDSPPSSDAVEATKTGATSDFSSWRNPTLGWRSTCKTRALFVAHWDPEELARQSGSVAWLETHDDSTIGDLANGTKPEVPPAMSAAEYGELLDSVAAIDSQNNGWSPTNDSTAANGMGCAICFGAGLLAHCGKCSRAYHLDCHLPRLSVQSLTPGWFCALCEDQDAASTAHVEQSDGTGLSRVDFLAGCRILMGLLVHAEAAHFTATVCPACSAPLLTPGRSVPHCPAGHLYHRLAELRLQLEEAASFRDGGTVAMDDLEDHDGASKPPSGGRIRLTDLDDWLVEVDKFWSDAANEDNHYRGASAGCLRAARRLRASLASLVKVHRPQSHASLVALCDPEQSEPSADPPVDFGKALFIMETA